MDGSLFGTFSSPLSGCMAEQEVAMEEIATQQRPTRQGGPENPWPDESEYQLPIHGFEGTPEEIERQWF